MNPSFMAAGYVHTIPEKLIEYFTKPLTNITVIFILIVMCANTYMFKKLWKIRTKDYMIIINFVTIGIYVFMGTISAVLVSRLGPHGTLKEDTCDVKYMTVPKTIFFIVAMVNVIYFVVNLFSKMKKDEEKKETEDRGYYKEDEDSNEDTDEEDKAKNNMNFDISSLAENIKDKIDLEGIKDKVNEFSDNIRDLINKKDNKD